MTRSLAISPDQNSAENVLAPENWMDWLSTSGWSWEFLRRSPDYIAAYNAFMHADFRSESEASPWGLRYFEDPDLDAASANVFWKLDASHDVMPLQAVPASNYPKASPFPFDRLSCRITVRSYTDEPRSDVLFANEGCFLQLAIFGDVPLDKAVLLTPVVTDGRRADRQREAMRRLDDLVRTGTLRPSLYRQETRVRRLKRVLHALDASLAQQSHREIAISMFGAERVLREWSDPRESLRDHVRRAVRSGRDFMEGGYRQLLTRSQ
jgi:hypothetical protein